MTNDCPSPDRLTAFLEGTLPNDETPTVDAHLTECARCQSALDGMTESHLSVQLGARQSEASDPKLSKLIARLSVMSPSVLAGDGAVTSSGVRFPGPPTDEAPLGALGPYLIKEQIGDGASGLLYRAIDSRVQRVVAIKVLRSELASQEESRQRLAREARAAAGLKHENVVTLFDFGDDPTFPPYLVMEYIDGETLTAKLKREETLPVREAISTIIPIARALAEAHRTGLVHRDVKPSNVLLESDGGKPKITDFGLALLDDDNQELTREGSLAGTPAYISPEQIIDPHTVDGRTDTYSLGVVLYQLLTGELPFKGVVRMTLLAVLHKEPQPPRQLNDQIPADVETIVLKSMSKDPAKRYQTTDNFADDLQRWLDGHPISARPVGRIERLTRWCKRNPRIAALSTAVAVLLTTVSVGSVIASVNLAQARRKAEESAQLAASQRDQAFATLQRLVYEVNEKFEDENTSVDQIQRTVLDISVRGLTDIARTADGAGQTDVSAAAAHLRLGSVLDRLADETDPRDSSRAEDARQHLSRGEAILERLGGESSDDWSVVKHLIEAKWFQSDFAYNEENYGRAVEHLEDAVDFAQSASGKWPNFDSQFSLAKSLSLLADRLYEDATERTEAVTKQAIETWDALEQIRPEDTDVRLESTNSRDTLATYYYDEEQYDKAVPIFKEVIKRCQNELARDPYQGQYATWLLLGHQVLSDIALQEEDQKTAIEHLVAAMKVDDEYQHYLRFDLIQGIQRDLDELRPPGKSGEADGTPDEPVR